MIPKKIHYCWFGKKEKPQLQKDVLQVGKSIVRIMKLLSGTKKILISI